MNDNEIKEQFEKALEDGHEWLSVRQIKDFLIDTINAYDWD